MCATRWSSSLSFARTIRGVFHQHVSLFCPSPLGLASGQFPRSASSLGTSCPAGFGSPSQIAGFGFCKSTNNLLLTLRKTAFACLERGTLHSGRPNQSGQKRNTNKMLCKNRITLIGFLGQDAESRSTPNGNAYTRFSLATSVSWRQKGRTEGKKPAQRLLCTHTIGPRGYCLSAELAGAPGGTTFCEKL